MNEVWIFNGNKNRFPSAVFGSRREAETWVRSNNLSGTLTKYPVGLSVYDWALKEGFFTPKRPDQESKEFVANFSSAHQEHYHFEPNENA